MSIEALEEVVGLLKAKGLAYWVTGGYAVDLAVNRITREHKNTDFLIKVEDSGRARDALEKNDYLISYVKDRIKATKGNRVVNLITMEDSNGDYVIPTINVYAIVPRSLMKPVKQELEGKKYARIPNELLYL